ncbi:MAG: 3-methyl-2-oxobutanoate dehydrogenase subunit VorB [Candidatus Glassbacteria bacterium]|nr:3-methyl-2-oxobutanoate dehydrogenase subunit VorB [Candidatus Glassbacteria bacterium]
MQKRVLITGNEACGAGAIAAGCDCYFGYPITPQNELTAYMSRHMPEQGRVFVQAESEVSAINMVYGASAAGRRVMTSSSSPGISLKQEGISYLAGSELPAVIINVQRGGPGLGNIEPSQADYFQAVKGGGHGDYRMIVLAPSSVQEMYDFTRRAFYLADRYRMPVMVLSDGRLGQMMEPLRPGKGSKSSAAKLPPKDWALTGASGGRPKRVVKSFFPADGTLERHNLELEKKYNLIRRTQSRAGEYFCEDAEVVLAAYGTAARLCREAVRRARAKGLPLGLLRPVTLWPFPAARVKKLAARARAFLVVEMSSGQMVEDVRLAVEGRVPVAFYGRSGGGVPEIGEIYRRAHRLLREKAQGGSQDRGTVS